MKPRSGLSSGDCVPRGKSGNVIEVEKRRLGVSYNFPCVNNTSRTMTTDVATDAIDKSEIINDITSDTNDYQTNADVTMLSTFSSAETRHVEESLYKQQTLYGHKEIANNHFSQRQQRHQKKQQQQQEHQQQLQQQHGYQQQQQQQHQPQQQLQQQHQPQQQLQQQHGYQQQPQQQHQPQQQLQQQHGYQQQPQQQHQPQQQLQPQHEYQQQPQQQHQPQQQLQQQKLNIEQHRYGIEQHNLLEDQRKFLEEQYIKRQINLKEDHDLLNEHVAREEDMMREQLLQKELMMSREDSIHGRNMQPIQFQRDIFHLESNEQNIALHNMGNQIQCELNNQCPTFDSHNLKNKNIYGDQPRNPNLKHCQDMIMMPDDNACMSNFFARKVSYTNQLNNVQPVDRVTSLHDNDIVNVDTGIDCDQHVLDGTTHTVNKDINLGMVCDRVSGTCPKSISTNIFDVSDGEIVRGHEFNCADTNHIPGDMVKDTTVFELPPKDRLQKNNVQFLDIKAGLPIMKNCILNVVGEEISATNSDYRINDGIGLSTEF